MRKSKKQKKKICHATEHVQNNFKNLENLEIQITNDVSTNTRLDYNNTIYRKPQKS